MFGMHLAGALGHGDPIDRTGFGDPDVNGEVLPPFAAGTSCCTYGCDHAHN
ncbi:hypothetical protein ACNKHV_20550 [Shigella flexneri]